MVNIVVGPDCDCPVCGVKEVENTSLPVAQWRWNVRPNKVQDERGLWWSECLRCKETDGNGWFAIDKRGRVVIEPGRIATMEAKGHKVQQIKA